MWKSFHSNIFEYLFLRYLWISFLDVSPKISTNSEKIGQIYLPQICRFLQLWNTQRSFHTLQNAQDECVATLSHWIPISATMIAMIAILISAMIIYFPTKIICSTDDISRSLNLATFYDLRFHASVFILNEGKHRWIINDHHSSPVSVWTVPKFIDRIFPLILPIAGNLMTKHEGGKPILLALTKKRAIFLFVILPFTFYFLPCTFHSCVDFTPP